MYTSEEQEVAQTKDSPPTQEYPRTPKGTSPRLRVNHGEQEFLHAPGTVGYRTVHQQPGSNFQGSQSALLEFTTQLGQWNLQLPLVQTHTTAISGL